MKLLFIFLFIFQIIGFSFTYKFLYEKRANNFKIDCQYYQNRFENFSEELIPLEPNYPGIKKVLIDSLLSQQQHFVSKCIKIPTLTIEDFLKHARAEFEKDQMGFSTYEHFQASLLNIAREYDILRGPQLYVVSQDFWLHSFSQTTFQSVGTLSSNSILIKWIEITQRLLVIFIYIGLVCSFRKR